MYCSAKCQKRHWSKVHSVECPKLGKSTEKLDEEELEPREVEMVDQIFRISMQLVEEAESQLYEDDGGKNWLFLDSYKLPHQASPLVEMNVATAVPHPFLYQEPEDFRPKMNVRSRPPQFQYLDEWGLPPTWERSGHGNQMDQIQQMMAMMNAGAFGDGNPAPQIQFVEQLMELKKEKLKESRLDPENSPDLVLKVELMGTQPRIWRRVQVPAAIPLFTLADKVLTPVMGWVRNFHAYSFVDVRDGAHFGPVRMNSVDMVHVPTNFYAMMDDEKVQLGQLARKKGEQLVWVYDIGDYWEHLITVERVAAPSGVRLLDGEMSCPPENEKGNKIWQEEVLDHLPRSADDWDGVCLSASLKLKEKLYQVIHTMVNLRESGQLENKGDGIMRCCFYDPFDFDLQHHRYMCISSQHPYFLVLKNFLLRDMLRLALASNLRSQEGGSKVFMMRLGKDFDKVDGDAALRPKRRGCAPQRTEKGMYEEVSLRRDKRELALCGQCGKTGG